MKILSRFNRILALFLVFITAMVLVRIYFSGNIKYVSILWNIFLGWIPYALALAFPAAHLKAGWKQFVLFGSWLIFFPNALYIVTDLIHLGDESNVPLWYDAILLFASSFIGIIMAFISLRKAERFLRRLFGPKKTALVIPAILFISSYGVYLGRFERWNSWDVITDPAALAFSIGSSVLSPVDNYRVWAITLLFTGIYSLLYFSIKILPYAFSENKHTGH
ncbi:MAG: DUF1361 domain-containing protein [Ferruginibacter sp.]